MEATPSREEEIMALCRSFSGDCGLVIYPLDEDRETVYHPDHVFSAASLIKLPMMLAYALQAQEGALDPQQRVALRAEDKVPGSGVLQDLAPGCLLTLHDLVTLMIILSDNTATNMMIDVLGMDPVNDLLDRLGLRDTRLRRKMYDWEAQKRGVENMTTARDMAALLTFLWRSEQLADSTREQLLAILRRQHYRSKLPALTADPDRWAHKTGELENADHDAGFLLPAEPGDTAVIVALLTSGAGGQQERVQLANQIGRLVYERFTLPVQATE
jgi:beta-lactamase class A